MSGKWLKLCWVYFCETKAHVCAHLFDGKTIRATWSNITVNVWITFTRFFRQYQAVYWWMIDPYSNWLTNWKDNKSKLNARQRSVENGCISCSSLRTEEKRIQLSRVRSLLTFSHKSKLHPTKITLTQVKVCIYFFHYNVS